MLADMMERDRVRQGFTVAQAAARLGLSPAPEVATYADTCRECGRIQPWSPRHAV